MRDSKIVEVIAFSLGDETHLPCLVMERMRETLYDFLGVDALTLPLAMKASLSLDVCEVSLCATRALFCRVVTLIIPPVLDPRDIVCQYIWVMIVQLISL